MEKRILILTMLALFSLAVAEDEIVEGREEDEDFHWGYSGSSGPDYWGQHYPLCNGLKQSPINIEPKKGLYSQYLHKQPLELIGYDKPLVGTDSHLKNNGHTVAVRFNPGGAAIAKGGLPGMYYLSQFHWHWGKNNSFGSEHTYDGKSYPMEMHLVHLNSRHLDNTSAIQNSKDGIAVLGVFIEVGQHNPAFDPIVDYLHKSSESNATEFSVPLTLPTLREFLPDDLARYYRYEGSLTTPPCFEAVIWTVLKKPIQISQEQLDEFRTKLKKDKSANKTPSSSNLIVDNFRPVMPIGKRTVFVSYGDETTGIVESDILHLKNWGYYGGADHGLAPHQWDQKFGQCGGSQQSPVHIEHSKTSHSTELSNSPWQLENYDSLPSGIQTLLENNGHTVVVALGDGVAISGGGLPGKYRLAQFHVHWGRHNSNGSEHMLNGRQYPAEIHFVHTNMYYGKDFDQVEANSDGLAVLGVFIEVGEHNPAFDPFINQLSEVKYESAERVELAFQSLRKLLPDDMSEFYRYAGSLTTPPCYEIVVWTVFKNTIKISQEQLNQFRTKVFDSPSPDSQDEGHGAGGHSAGQAPSATAASPAASTTTAKPHTPAYILDNFRPLQDIGYRVVRYAKILPDAVVGSSSTLSLSAYCVILCAAVLIKSLA